MFLDLSQILKQRIEEFEKNPQGFLNQKGKDYNKDWAKAVQCFQLRLNKDRKKEKKPPYTYIIIRQKLAHIKEIDDLRFFYRMCLDYRYKKKGNTFAKCFFGALKIK